ncbi:MAG: diguanylate cyclase [Acidobacteria bacterium]|nr:diguanylate cyclase [Acidobacteriota bacterium]
MKTLTTILLTLLLPATIARAQAVDPSDPGQALTQYRIDGWQTEQGLPLNTVQVLHRTRDGYLWVGTGGGLARFDGIRFRTFDLTAVPELPGWPIYGLMEDPDGNLWIGHSEGAMIHRDGLFRPVLGAEVTAGRRVWSFAPAPDGSMWIATENGLVHWKNNAARLYQVSDGLPTERLRALTFDRDGLLWIATSGGGLVSFDGERFELFDESNGFPNNQVRSVIADPEGGVWAGTAGGGLVHLRDGRIRTWTVADGLPTDQLTTVDLDEDGSLWIGTWGEGLARMRNGKFDSISVDGGLAGEQIWSVLADREGSVWVGTWVGGLNRLRDRDFVVLGTPEGLSHDNVRSVTHAPDGAAWATTAGGGANRIHRGTITHIGVEEGLRTNETSCVYADRSGAIWIGSYTDGLARWRDGVIETWGVEDGLPSGDIRSVLEDRNGTIWIGTVEGLARFTGDRFEPIVDENLPVDGVGAILAARDGSLWIGLSGEGLVRYREGVFTTFTREDGLLSNWIMALHEDSDGGIWIGTNGEGLNRYRDGKIAQIEPENGLWDGLIQTILEDDRGRLWMTCNRGFFAVSRAELDAFADGRIERVTPESYGPGNALRSTTFAGTVQPAGAIDAAGNLWLPSFRGLVIVDPDDLPGHEGPPAVRLEEVIVDGERRPLDEKVTLPPGSAPLWIRYTAATLQNAERVNFRYRMDGAPGGWVDAGTSREAFFPALPHGNYTFHVAASFDGQTWQEAATALPIAVRPYFFQTPWFIALLVIGIAAVIAVTIWLWTRHLRLQQTEMERLVAKKTEELRLANDHLERLSFVDPLTGLANRRRFDEKLDEEWRRAARSQTPLALMVADVDLFKDYNDSLGHPEGDRCLVAVAEVLRDRIRRPGDLVARYGGEEFVVLVPGTDLEAATRLAEELRKAVEDRAIAHPNSSVAPVVTISLGVASCVPSQTTESESLFTAADPALYRAKREGRNRVAASSECASEESEHGHPRAIPPKPLAES